VHALDLKLPPLALVAAAASLMWLVARAAPAFAVEIAGGNVAAAAFVLVGAAITVAGVVSFKRAKTTVNPLTPSSASSLVVRGVYRFTRNPMYLGFLLALVGWAIHLSNALSFAVLPAFVLYMNRFQIGPEERALGALFPDEFAEYAARVRRWI
jgi:protein-S-isoprenylcysteine O-methyltransferase Ste14